MAAQIASRFQFVPGVNPDNIKYQWTLGRGKDRKIVSIINVGYSLPKICHVYGLSVSENIEIFTKRSLEYWEKSASWEQLIPDVVDTDKGPMCILKRRDEKCVLKSYLKTANSVLMIYLFNRFIFLDLKSNRVWLKDENFYEIPKLVDSKEIDAVIDKVEKVQFSTLIVSILSTYFIKPSISIPLPGKWSQTRFLSYLPRELPIPNPLRIFLGETWGKRFLLTSLVSLSGSMAAFLASLPAESYKRRYPKFIVDRVVLNGDKVLDDIQVNAVELESEFDIGEEIQEESDTPNYRWEVDGKEITIFQRKNQIIYVVRNAVNRKGILTGIHEEAPNEEEARQIMQILSKRCVYLEDNGVPFFARILKRWNIGDNKELRVIREEDGLRWWIFDKRTRTNIRNNILVEYLIREVDLPILEELSPRTQLEASDQCSEGTQKYLYALSDEPIGEQYSILTDFNPKKVKVLNCMESKFIRVVVQPISIQQSKIDSRVSISKFTWAVTLIRMGIIHRMITDHTGVKRQMTAEEAIERLRNRNAVQRRVGKVSGEAQHAQIIIEGIADCNMQFIGEDSKEELKREEIKEGKYFCILSDFNGGDRGINSIKKAICGTGPAKVIMKDYSSRDVLYVERSQVWKRSSKNIHKMLEQIKKEVIDPRNFLSRNVINKLGRDSVTANRREDSCITWTKEKLRMIHIDLPGPIVKKNLATFTSDYTYPEAFHDENIPKDHNLL